VSGVKPALKALIRGSETRFPQICRPVRLINATPVFPILAILVLGNTPSSAPDSSFASRLQPPLKPRPLHTVIFDQGLNPANWCCWQGAARLSDPAPSTEIGWPCPPILASNWPMTHPWSPPPPQSANTTSEHERYPYQRDESAGAL
jgi:hypothetical protein